MESSPLIKAHDHAKAASDATQTSNSTVAINEHTLAAGEFSNAARSTTSVEALRTLKLLEQHHQRLSELLKFSADHPIKHVTSEKDAEDSGEKTPSVKDAADAKPDPVTEAGAKHSAIVPGPPAQRRYPPSRELSSSIASNLASARGIRTTRYRGQPLTPSISNDQAPGNVEMTARKDGSRTKMQHMLDQTGKPSWVPPVTGSAQRAETRTSTIEEAKEEDDVVTTPTDEGFSRFYSTFGSIINRLSAPLAFAGLPLITEDSSAADVPTPDTSSPKRNRGKSVQMVHEEPDISKIYSRAALRAVSRDGNSTNDSFYVVPTSGHTMSYANILNFEQKEKRRLAASMHGGEADIMDDPDDDDFVDARESQMSLPPGSRKRAGKTHSEKQLYNVIEELNVENASLKDMLDKVSKRLQAFEATAQHSRLALADSMRLIRPGSPMSSSGGGGQSQVTDEALRKRNGELEDELAKARMQFELLEKDYARTQKTVAKYRDKWDKLKAGAKARREAQSSTENGEGSRSPM